MIFFLFNWLVSSSFFSYGLTTFPYLKRKRNVVLFGISPFSSSPMCFFRTHLSLSFFRRFSCFLSCSTISSFSSFSLYFYSFFLNALFYLSLSASLSTLTLSLLLLDSIPFLSLFLSPFCTSAGIAPIFASRYLFSTSSLFRPACLKYLFLSPVFIFLFFLYIRPSSFFAVRCVLSQCRSSIS